MLVWKFFYSTHTQKGSPSLVYVKEIIFFKKISDYENIMQEILDWLHKDIRPIFISILIDFKILKKEWHIIINDEKWCFN